MHFYEKKIAKKFGEGGMFDVSLHRRSGKRARQGRKMTSNLCLTSA
jgi:hypothetical protein